MYINSINRILLTTLAMVAFVCNMASAQTIINPRNLGTGTPTAGKTLIGSSAWLDPPFSGDISGTLFTTGTVAGVQGNAWSTGTPGAAEYPIYDPGVAKFIYLQPTLNTVTTVVNSNTVTVFSGVQNFNGLTLHDGSEVWLNDQGDGTSGEWIEHTGAWTRATPIWETGETVPYGYLVFSRDGTPGLQTLWSVTSATNVIGTNTITLGQLPNGSSSSVSVDYISGCNLIYDTTTAIEVNTGTVGLANGSSYTVSSVITNSPTLAASTLYYVFLTSASAVTVSSTAPSTNYAGTAWDDGTTSHRYVGSFLTDASSHIYRFLRAGILVTYETNTKIAPFLVLTNGTATTATSISCSGIVPATSRRINVIVAPGGSSGASGQFLYLGTSDFVPTSSGGNPFLSWSPSGTPYYSFITADLNSTQALEYILAQSASLNISLCVSSYYEPL
jgi:hypothetical protein